MSLPKLWTEDGVATATHITDENGIWRPIVSATPLWTQAPPEDQPVTLTVSATTGANSATITWAATAGTHTVNAVVISRSGSTATTSYTALNGSHVFANLPSGSYTLRARATVDGVPGIERSVNVTVSGTTEPPPPPPPPGGARMLLGIYPFGGANMTTFQSAETTSVYGQPGISFEAAGGTPNGTGGASPGDDLPIRYLNWNTADQTAHGRRGTATVATLTWKYTNRIMWGGAPSASGTRYNQVMAEVDGWGDRLGARATAVPNVPVYGTHGHEHDVYSNPTKTGTENYYDGLNADPVTFGRFQARTITRQRSRHPLVKWGVWFGGSRTDHIRSVLATLVAQGVYPDWISFDPYNQEPTFQMPQQNWAGHFNACRTSGGTYYAQYQALCDLAGFEIGIAITETGVSYARGTQKRHSQTDRARWVRGMREAIRFHRAEFVTYFNSSGPLGAYALNEAWTGEDPQITINAWRAEQAEAR